MSQSDQDGAAGDVPRETIDLLEMKLRKCFEARRVADQLRESQALAFEKVHEDLVESREVIARQGREARSVFKYITQGIALVSADLKISAQKSESLERILDRKIDSSDEQLFTEILFENSNLSKDDFSRINTVLQSAIGESEFLLEMNRHHLPRAFTLKNGSQEKQLEIDFNPILDADGKIEQFIIVLRDVTEVRRLEQNTKIKDAELKIITEIIVHETQRVEEFLEGAQHLSESNLELIGGGRKDRETIDQLFRNAHTIKGGSRVFGFQSMIDRAHDLEETFQRTRADIHLWDHSTLLQGASHLHETVVQYLNILNQRIKKNEQRGLPSYLKKIIDFLERHEKLGEETGEFAFDKIKALFRERGFSTISEILASLTAFIPRLAEELGKPAPLIEFINNHVGLADQIRPMLNDVFTHCFRNALDHGIEDPNQRIQLGKNPRGCITIKVVKNEGRVSIHFEDDGRGLDLVELLKRAVSFGIKADQLETDDQIASTLFISGISTARSITAISGRGVGMDAVRAFLKSYEGSIQIEFKSERSSSGFRAFRFTIGLPEKYAIALT